ncbi:hypothetical protein [Streptomyces sp. 1331.2]|uniref:hypothetical protein n=1 Tax=Streptomyces sp. 1331.2 TaxID=1938835 RepID=UPI000BD51E9A|nr:hypothetical protein [Streptomyces sp. 1331.2]SOB83160.1 hypothetical protein SAMN06272789_3358 [Streptomyces sp. 1331.2]
MNKPRAGHLRIIADPALIDAVLAILRADPSVSIARFSRTYPETDGRLRLYVRLR